MEAIRKTLSWRLHNLRSAPKLPQVPGAFCLPLSVLDPLKHPILVLRLATVDLFSETLRPAIIQGMEFMRIRLKKLNARIDATTEEPVLQYVVLLDVADVSVADIVRT